MPRGWVRNADRTAAADEPIKNESGSDATFWRLAGGTAASARLSVPTIAEPGRTALTADTPGTWRLEAKLDGCRLTTLGVPRRSDPTTNRASLSFSIW